MEKKQYKQINQKAQTYEYLLKLVHEYLIKLLHKYNLKKHKQVPPRKRGEAEYIDAELK